MVRIAFQRPTVKPVHEFGWVRPPGNDEFVVTQRFTDLDSYWSGTDPDKARLTHQAVDLGNGRCGYSVIAMASGVTRHLRDNATSYGAPTDALGVEVTHHPKNPRVTTEVWHLDRITVGAGLTIPSGYQLGLHGKTGLGTGCHIHLEVKVDGVRIDPTPFIFGGTLDTEALLGMNVWGENPSHVVNQEASVTVDSRYRREARRRDANGTDTTIAVLPAGAKFIPTLKVTGETVGTAPDASDWYYGVKTQVPGVTSTQYGCVHSSVLPRTPDGKGVVLTPIQDADCSEAVRDATARGMTIGKQAERERWQNWVTTAPK